MYEIVLKKEDIEYFKPDFVTSKIAALLFPFAFPFGIPMVDILNHAEQVRVCFEQISFPPVSPHPPCFNAFTAHWFFVMV